LVAEEAVSIQLVSTDLCLLLLIVFETNIRNNYWFLTFSVQNLGRLKFT